MKIQLKRIMVKLVAVTLVVTFFGFQSQNTMAASLTSLSDNLSRLRAATLANHDIRFVTPTGVDASTDTITLTFNDFTMGSFALLNFDLAVSASGACTTFGTEKTLSTSAGAGVWGVGQSGQTVTFTPPTDATGGEIAAGRCVQIEIGSNATAGGNGAVQITNGDVANDDTITIAGNFGDTGVISVDIITDDQVVITATVDPSITFAVSDNTIEFGTLSASAARFADDVGGNATEVEAHTLQAGTNATSGYVMYVFGPTLTSGGNTVTAIGGANTASSVGSEQFGIRFTASGGSGTVSVPYAAAGFAYDGASAPDEIAAATGTTATTTFSARYIANIASQTEAGSYSTTLTYTATATY
jgi:hypothetical protein